MSTKVTINYTFEDEDGINPTSQPATFEFELTCSYSPGERMVRYFSDGSGYPGSPPEVEILSVKLLSVQPDEPIEFKSNGVTDFAIWFLKYVQSSDYHQRKFFEQVCEQVEADHYSWLADREDY